MSTTLITLNCEALLTSASFRPCDIQILLGTKDGDIFLHEIEPPEEEPSGSFDSENYDVENKYGLHDAVIATEDLKSAIRYTKWLDAERLFVVCKDFVTMLAFRDGKFSPLNRVDLKDVSVAYEVVNEEEEYVFPRLKFSTNPKTKALQKAVFQPMRREKFEPRSIGKDSVVYAFGTDDGEVVFYDWTANAELFRFHDCGDYVSAIQEVDDIIVCASGDGTIYLYRVLYGNESFAARLEDNSMPEETDFNCMALIDDLAFVGTTDGHILSYDISNIITHKERLIASKESIESLIVLPGNILLAASDSGQVLIISVFPAYELLGSLTVASCSNGQILTGNSDHSLLLIGGGDTNLNVEDMEWYVEDYEKKEMEVVKAPEADEERFEAEEEIIELSSMSSENAEVLRRQSQENVIVKKDVEMVNYGPDEDPSDVSDLSTSGESNPQSVGEVTGGHIRTMKDRNEIVKVIEGGHVSEDSSFSDFFKPMEPAAAKTKKDQMKKSAYSESATVAKRQAFLKDMDSD